MDAAAPAPRPDGPGFTVAAVILRDAAGRFLAVRKAGTELFMLPGGKIEPGETSDATAVREVAEELGLVLHRPRLRLVGSFLTAAANEPGHWLASDVYAYTAPVSGERPGGEIAEARWFEPFGSVEGHAPLTVALLEVLQAPPQWW